MASTDAFPSGMENEFSDDENVILDFMRKILEYSNGTGNQLSHVQSLLKFMKLPGIAALNQDERKRLKGPFFKASAEKLALKVAKFILLDCKGTCNKEKVLEGLTPLCSSSDIKPIEPPPTAMNNNAENEAYNNDGMVQHNVIYFRTIVLINRCFVASIVVLARAEQG
jgi:hypothetical protein